MTVERKDLKVAKEVLKLEAKAILKTSERLNEKEFSHAIDILHRHSGKIVVTGIGKSGHVGKKIAALLCSTGSPACFLHPAEAVHGDLGIHKHGDPVIYLSNSGSTPELLFGTSLEGKGASLVGILGKMNSPLAEKMDAVIDGTVASEADPLRIVPTASFSVASAIGDAIASALMVRKNFDKNEYAQTHPAGQLGRNLILKVGDVMHQPNKIACLNKAALVKEAVILMTQYPLGAACVVENNKLLGILTDGDLRRALNNVENLLNLKVSDIMTNQPSTITPNIFLGKALELMEKRKPTPISILPVVSEINNEFLGLIRFHDIFDT